MQNTKMPLLNDIQEDEKLTVCVASNKPISTNRTIILYCLIIFCCAMSGCLPAYSPFFFNGGNRAVAIRAKLDGRWHEIPLPSRTASAEGIPNQVLSAIEVRTNKGQIFKYSSEDLNQERISKRFSEELWIVNNGKVKLHDCRQCDLTRPDKLPEF